ncbi:acetolactate synthase-1/2/3 large subunit [Sphingomonas vulcanisoli]|uniref:Acetolactate synthase-1/2/3 large subunit n=1 Tax=Sphingomonas vulcanisoli TaxID=1658060 RepID=A0ABX0TYJ4_9SPHN|nr:thiamine pyrophosphate-binding protein [Sphingomonas vulcanisoli]NIJ09450.1 acetolactate synthase-1/2/3 large subunit [Sphingomonas vulcanisoli]
MGIKYSDVICDWLKEAGYRKCFFVAGGNIMHSLESARHRFDCHPVAHEVAAVIATEYYNAVAPYGQKAFALVTAGPGLTNTVTGLAGAFLESREVLLLGGQVKSADLARGELRQRGIQEIDGVTLVSSITKRSVLIDNPVSRAEFMAPILEGGSGRPGPVFLELCLDAQGAPISDEMRQKLEADPIPVREPLRGPSATEIGALEALVAAAERPILLIGGGLGFDALRSRMPALERAGIPIATTWNGADRIDASHPLYFGRVNTWGQRYANILVQQSDLVIALGTRLGLQQTGFNWQQFAPVGKVVQVDIDPAELSKGHPRVDLPIEADAAAVLDVVLAAEPRDHSDWLDFCRMVKAQLPLVEACNNTRKGFVSPFAFVSALSEMTNDEDVIVPCSSGGAFTVVEQVFAQKGRQHMPTNKGLASMGYGLSAAIGAALAYPERRTILFEGDGGFLQNVQEVGTAAVNKLNLKIFIFDDNGYASIRMTQKNYFGGGAYVGCDTSTGLGMPDWEKLFPAYGVPVMRLQADYATSADFKALFDAPGVAAFLIPIDSEQTYFPKIMSRVTDTGAMESNPIHAMSPPPAEDVIARVYRYIPSPY